MLNECFFLLQFALCLSFLVGAVRLGPAALIALISLQGVVANLFILKQVHLFGLTLTCSDVFAIGSMLGLGLLQEYFGKEEAKRGMKVAFLTLLFFVAVSQVHLWYVPAESDRSQGAFATLFSATPRIVFSSLFVYFLVQRLEISLFGYLKGLFSGRWLALRMCISLFVTQGLDTLLFSFLALYGVVASLLDVMLVSFFIKCLVIGFGSPIAALSRRFIKERDVSL